MPLQRTIVVRLWKISSILFMRAVKRRERRAPAAPVWQWLFVSNIASIRNAIVKTFFRLRHKRKSIPPKKLL